MLSLSLSLSTKLKQAALQNIYTQARGYPERCHWPEHFKAALLQLLDVIHSQEEASVRSLALRILREMLKTEHKRLVDFAEITTLRVLASFTDSDATVSPPPPIRTDMNSGH